MATRNVVPMPAFTDPHDQRAAQGSLNYGVSATFPDVDAHPMPHSEDYGGALGGVELGDDSGDERDGWTKAQWSELAEAYDLSASGTKQEIIDRVEEFEREQEGSEG